MFFYVALLRLYQIMLNNYLIALRIEDDHFKIPPPKKTHEKDKILPCSAPCWAAQRP